MPATERATIPWTKDPVDTLWFTFDWTSWLQTGETITQYGTSVDTNAVKMCDQLDGAQVFIEITGGTTGTKTLATCTITTSMGATYSAHKWIYINTRIG